MVKMLVSEETPPSLLAKEEIRPGEQLRMAREEHGFKLAEVAANLRLRVGTVQAMENERWDLLPGKTFVLGYVRSYCKFLGVPPDPLLAKVLEEWHPASPAPRSQANARPLKSSHWAIRSITYLLIVLLGTLIVIAWEENTPFVPNEALIKTPREQEKAAGGGSAAFLAAPESDNSKVGKDPQLALQDLTLFPTMPAEQPALLLEEESFGEESRKTVFPLIPITEESLLERGEKAQESGISAPARLSLRLTGDSWVELYDGTGKPLVYKLLKAGTRQELTGIAPLRAIIGNAIAAEIEFNGQPLELAPHTQGNVARFTVGSPGNQN